MTDVMVPALGESVSEATVSTWFKKVGDTVAQDEMLCELETDKVSVEVPSPIAGVLVEIIAQEGETVAANARLAIVSEGAAGAAPAAPAAKAEAPKAAPAPTGKDVEDAPSARKAMAEAGLFDKLVKVKYEIPNDKPEMFGEYNKELDDMCAQLLAKQTPAAG